MTETLNFPTEIIELPSKGLLYPEGHPLSSGKVEMKYMTAREEDILTNSNYIEQGIVIDKLIQSLCVTKFDYDDLLIGDKNMLLIASRILGYGADYKISYGDDDYAIVNLTELTKKTIDSSIISALNKNDFNYKLPVSNVEITFKFLTQGDEKRIEEELKGLKKLSPNSSHEITTRLKYSITSVAGDRKLETIRSFVDKMLAKDSRALRMYINSISPDINMNISFTTNKGRTVEGATMPITAEFFWPE
jgi:hypothetical protein